MTIQDLSKELKNMHENAEKGKIVVNIHLFGIIYGSTIIENNFNRKEIIKLSGINSSYFAELNKGINLSQFVKLK